MSKLPSAQGDKAPLTDAGQDYLWLAAIEELAGNGSLSHQYVLNAQESFRSTGRDIPEEKLNQEVAKITALARKQPRHRKTSPTYMSGRYLGRAPLTLYT